MGVVKRGKVQKSDLLGWDGRTLTGSRVDATGGTVTGLVADYEVDVLEQFGSSTTYSLGTINSALQHIGSSNVTLVFAPGTWTIDDDLTIASNFTCHIPAGCIFDVASGKTLTFSGPVFRESETWTSGSGSVSEGGTFLRIKKSAAEIAAGITLSDMSKEYGFTSRYTNGLKDALLVAVESTATVERNIIVTEDHTLGSGDEITVPTTGTAISTHGMSVRAVPGVYIIYTGTGVAVTIGSSAAVSRNVYWNVPILNSAQNWDDGTDTTSYGLRIIGVDRSEIHVDIEGFNVGLHVYGDTLGNVHNKFFVRELLDNRIQLLVDRNPASEGWSNSNRFYGGLANYRSGTMTTAVANAIVVKHIDQADDLDNANEFFIDCEAVVSGTLPAAATVLEFNGEYNHFRGRMEVTNTNYTQTILFPNSGNSEFNTVIITRGTNTAEEISLGVSNLGSVTNSVTYGGEELTDERESSITFNKSTTDATPVVMTFNVPPEYAGTWVECRLVVFSDDSVLGLVQFRHAFIQRITTGNLAINAQANSVSLTDGFTGSAVFAVSGTNLQFTLTGMASENFRWAGTIKFQHAIGNL